MLNRIVWNWSMWLNVIASIFMLVLLITSWLYPDEPFLLMAFLASWGWLFVGILVLIGRIYGPENYKGSVWWFLYSVSFIGIIIITLIALVFIPKTAGPIVPLVGFSIISLSIAAIAFRLCMRLKEGTNT